MTNAEYIASYLSRRGVTSVFELTGGMITLLLDAIARHGSTRIVSMHHEQGAAFAAEGWARITGIPGVAFATSGPGATNLLTGIGSCYFDSTPAVFITGQVNSYEMKSRAGVRQQGFQETAIVEMVRPITKAAWLVTDGADLPRILDEAFTLSLDGRPGPVLIDIPMDIQRGTAKEPIADCQPHGREISPTPECDIFLAALNEALVHAKFPLVLAGGGIRAGAAAQLFRSFIRTTGLPVVHSLMGVDALDESFDQRIGLIGSYGNRWANLALGKSDLLLILGSRVDIRQTGSDIRGFQGDRSIFHVDICDDEMNNRIARCHTLRENLRSFLPVASQSVKIEREKLTPWINELLALRAQYPASKEPNWSEGINPIDLIEKIAGKAHPDTVFITDVGQHQMWAAQAARPRSQQRFLTSGGMGAMGFALPAAIGAAIAGRPVVVFAGDGGFQLNIQELQTVVRNQLPIKIFVLNNACHGMVRQFQESYFSGRFQSTVVGYSAPSFAAVGAAFGLPSRRVADGANLAETLVDAFLDPAAPFLTEVTIDQNINVYPKLAFGKPFGSMEPDCSPVEMEGT